MRRRPRRSRPRSWARYVIFVVDASAEVSWRQLSLGLSATNLLDTRYKQVELNYASDFPTGGSLPTLVPAVHFAAGPPRMVLLTLGIHLGGER